MYRRKKFDTLRGRLAEPRRFMQIVAGPRQVGKTTLARQVAEALDGAWLYVSADDPGTKGPGWLETQWERGRQKARSERYAVLFLDEVQKIPGWAEKVKALWDADSANDISLHVVLLGSSPLLMERGLTESLAGRFELVRLTHWSYPEMREAFGWDLSTYVFFGGYPGAAPLIGDERRWRAYINDSLVETSISRDVLLLNRVHKPALLRQLFDLACLHSGQALSYQKMCGQLQDAGNTTTLAHYLELLAGAGMVTGLQKYAGRRMRRRGSSPKLHVLNTALMTARLGRGFEEMRNDAASWGRLVESAVGAHLLNAADSEIRVYYWRERDREVDFVLEHGDSLTALEVKSAPGQRVGHGAEAFSAAFSPRRVLLVGGDGIPLDEFLSAPLPSWL